MQSRNQSQNTSRVASDVGPKELPSEGSKLMPGFQYELDPCARRLIFDLFGVAGVPTYVTCTKAARDAVERITITKNLRTGDRKVVKTEEPAQLATFVAYMGNGKRFTFTLDCESLVERRAAMTPAELYRDDVYERTDERPAARKAKVAKQPITAAQLEALW